MTGSAAILSSKFWRAQIATLARLLKLPKLLWSITDNRIEQQIQDFGWLRNTYSHWSESQRCKLHIDRRKAIGVQPMAKLNPNLPDQGQS